jgi:hypothetical protein
MDCSWRVDELKMLNFIEITHHVEHNFLSEGFIMFAHFPETWGFG